MAYTVLGGTVVGVDGVIVRVEVDLLKRLPCVVIVGLPGGAVRESADRVRSAIEHQGFEFPKRRVVINLAPADLRKRGTQFDLPIALAILAEAGQLPREKMEHTVFVGELSLDGQLKPVRGALPFTLMAREAGARRIVLPWDNAAEAALVDGIEVRAAHSFEQVCAWLEGEDELSDMPPARPVSYDAEVDLAEVRGQPQARRALEVAAAGGHNLLLIGPPGCGKTMLAARMPTILPSLSFQEAIDITRVHSVAGLTLLGQGIISRRPFRAPHHSISPPGMVGRADLNPGEVSLAHNGVLFLDEVAEFRRDVLEMLRAPLEDREIQVTRAKGTVRYPASVSLIAAANPCPCGYYGHPQRACRCAPAAIERYRNRLSGPLLDRIDLHVWVQPVDVEDLAREERGESSAVVRARVETARAIQRERFADRRVHCNAELRGDAVREYARPTDPALKLLRDIIDFHALSARSWSRMLKVSRTLADLDGSERVQPEHVLEASSFRVPFIDSSDDSSQVAS